VIGIPIRDNIFKRGVINAEAQNYIFGCDELE
jgi:hypothetical protein